MKTLYLPTLILAIIGAAFVLLGKFETNHMIAFGLILAVGSGLVTISITLTAKIQALKATFEPTEPVPDNRSFTFRNTTNLHNYANEAERQWASLQQEMRNLQEDFSKAGFEIRTLKTHMRICFDNFRYHEEITLPKALAGKAGAIVGATLLTLVGTALTAVPEQAHATAVTLYWHALTLSSEVSAVMAR